MTFPHPTPLGADAMQARSHALSEYNNARKQGIVAWLLWLFLGALGAHRFYMGHTGYAIGMLLTAGGFGVWALIDAFFINKNLRAINQRRWMEIAGRYQAPVEPMPEGTHK